MRRGCHGQEGWGLAFGCACGAHGIGVDGEDGSVGVRGELSISHAGRFSHAAWCVVCGVLLLCEGGVSGDFSSYMVADEVWGCRWVGLRWGCAIITTTKTMATGVVMVVTISRYPSLSYILPLEGDDILQVSLSHTHTAPLPPQHHREIATCLATTDFHPSIPSKMFSVR